jgi:hypothetical protein
MRYLTSDQIRQNFTLIVILSKAKNLGLVWMQEIHHYATLRSE